MTKNNAWSRAQSLELKVAENICSGFDIGFEKGIDAGMEQELRAFVGWLESRYRFPVTLWVDFEYKHYLVSRAGKRVGYLFYWSDVTAYPVFDCKDDIPQIRLPVRTEHSTLEAILTSLTEAVTDYYAWLCGELNEEYAADEDDVREIVQAYLHDRA
ncbi:MAG: hypothetical protein J6R04_07110 [Clostridia bacterium]|nr:hypothetical protein [Clostridia bacterium]